MTRAQIERLLASVPAHLDEGQRQRVDGFAATAHRCEERITAVRSDLQRALRALGAATGADEALRLACELDALERVQPRVDAWLRAAVGHLSDDPGSERFGEGPA
jgi:hypothetical protein